MSTRFDTIHEPDGQTDGRTYSARQHRLRIARQKRKSRVDQYLPRIGHLLLLPSHKALTFSCYSQADAAVLSRLTLTPPLQL